MTNFDTALQLLPYSITTKYEYKGISRRFFPKWEGWELLDKGMFDTYDLDEMIYHFYNSYYWVKLGLNEIKDQHLANLLFVFATKHGKRKALTKLQRILKEDTSGLVNTSLLKEVNNAQPNLLFLKLWAELVEFCVTQNDLEFISSMLPVYYQFERQG